MSRSFVLIAALAVAVATLVSAAAHAQLQGTTCNLGMVVSCSTGQCTSTTVNNGSNACSGNVFTGFVSQSAAAMTLTNFHPGITLGNSQCFDSTTYPQGNLAICFGTGFLAAGSSFTSTVTTNAGADAAVIGITEVLDPGTGDMLGFAYAINGASAPTCTPVVSVPSATLSGVPYTVSWRAVSDASATYEIDESTSSDFGVNAVTQTTTATSAQFLHSVTTATTYYYRVKAVSCGGQPGTYAPAVTILIQPPPPTTARGTDVVVPYGSTTPFLIPVSVQLPATQAGYSFTATIDKPYYSLTPQSGTVPQDGLVSIVIHADPSSLPAGASTGTLTVTTKAPGTVTSLDSTTVSLPVSVSLVTPVTPGGKGLPPANALIIPVVTHVVGQGNTPFVSDVRMTNASASAVTYNVTYTPSNSNGTTTGKITTITVPSGGTVALNDIVKDFFAIGATSNPSDFGAGALDIRPVNSASTATYASSRTYATTSSGTYGQFVAALPFSNFASLVSLLPPIGGTPAPTNSVLSLQQIAQSSKFRTNIGLVEGSGATTTGNIVVYDDNGTVVKTTPFSLQPGEQRQDPLTKYLPSNAVLGDGRVEIQVNSQTGAVSGYASVLDNITQDPLAVTPVAASQVHATRYTIPGMAEYIFDDGRNFHSDMRIFNGGSSDASVTLTFAGTDPGGATRRIALPAFTLPAGQIAKLDNVLPSKWNFTSSGNTGYGGSIIATTPSASSLVITGRTYSNAATGGTFGQFIPGVTPDEGIAAGDKPQQILQLEQSAQYRTNIGVAEVSGTDVLGTQTKVRITLILPDSKVAPVYDVLLNSNQFVQIPTTAILGSGTTAYNMRATIQVLSGPGRVTSYASVLDNQSTDPTYVPAQ